MNQTLRNILIFVGSLTLIGVALAMFNIEKPSAMDLTGLAREVENGNVSSIVVRGSQVEITLKNGTTAKVHKESGEPLSDLLKNYGVPTEKIRSTPTEVKETSGFVYWAGLALTNIIPFLVLFGIMWFVLRQVQGQNNRAMMFGQAGAREIQKDAKDKVTFSDVAGVKEAKEELTEIVEFLKTPENS